jgi:hypothetical protein
MTIIHPSRSTEPTRSPDGIWTCCPLKDNQENPCASAMTKDVHISLLMVAVCFIHTFLTCHHYSFSHFRSCRDGHSSVLVEIWLVTHNARSRLHVAQSKSTLRWAYRRILHSLKLYLRQFICDIRRLTPPPSNSLKITYNWGTNYSRSRARHVHRAQSMPDGWCKRKSGFGDSRWPAGGEKRGGTRGVESLEKIPLSFRVTRAYLSMEFCVQALILHNPGCVPAPSFTSLKTRRIFA